MNAPLPRKIIDIPALDSCRAWRSWQAKNAQIEKIEAEETRLGVQGKVLEARKKARLFGGAALYFDLGDDASQPLDVEKVRAGGVRFLTVLSSRQLQPGEIETDPLSPLYGRPRDYTIVNGASSQPRVHPSRLAIFIGNEMPDKDITSGATFAWGDSVLTSVMEAVKQADATSANIASLIFGECRCRHHGRPYGLCRYARRRAQVSEFRQPARPDGSLLSERERRDRHTDDAAGLAGGRV